jgi:membrane-bound lytic murein transglycosylase D
MIRPVKKGGGLHFRALKLLLLSAALCLPAHAVDTSLHRLSPEAFEIDPAVLREATQGVDVKEVRDLGGKSAVTGDQAAAPEDLWERIRRGFAMPDLDSPRVVKQQAWYSARPTQIRVITERSRLYLFHIVEELEKRGMPTELALLPMVESAMNPMAYSRARASGLWQFIPSTGKNYKLEQNWWYDARRDIVASTAAALDYLQFLYDMHGDWHLALASYNMGEYGVQRSVARNRAKGLPTDYESISMPKETRWYVPKLQALKNIINNPAAAGVELSPVANEPYFVTVELTRDIDLNIAATLAEMPVEELVALNPGHNRPLISTAIAPQLVLPADRAVVFVANLEEHKNPLTDWQVYRFKAGDRPETIAKKNGITLTKLREINRLNPRSKIAIGQLLLLPLKAGMLATIPVKPPIDRVKAKSKSKKKIVRKKSAKKAVAAKKPATVVKTSAKTKSRSGGSKTAQLKGS